MDIPKPQQYEGTNGKHPPRFKPGYSIPWFAGEPIDDSKTLAGNRYLCRGGGMLIVAPSGMGKSTLTIQLAILWAAGAIAFGIKPKRKLRILILQAEDDQGDCTEMSAMFEHLGLSDPEKKAVLHNTELIRCNDLTNSDFIGALRFRLQAAKDEGEPFDLVIINPYSTYLGDDVMSAKANVGFLVSQLSPVLTDFDIGAIIVHHTPKTNFTNFDNFKPWDWMYAGAGSAVITNWARAILFIAPQPTDERLFMFVAAKRGRRIGDEWENVSTKYFSHSDSDIMMWIDATSEQRDAAIKTKPSPKTKKNYSVKEVLVVGLSPVEWTSRIAYRIKVKEEPMGIGIHRADDYLKEGIAEGFVEVQENFRSGTNPEKGYRLK
jgi:hypothetical protein